mmetsp:Transcript_52566/g.125546  ORF Transcript_52566/g.125546 Transcript_52566/m.125546 type:complete len:118 (+) Transcript_52566:108-461(+)
MAAVMQLSAKSLAHNSRSLAMLNKGAYKSLAYKTNLFDRPGMTQKTMGRVFESFRSASFGATSEELKLGDLGYAPITQAGRLSLPLLGMNVSRSASRQAELLGGKKSQAELDFNPFM